MPRSIPLRVRMLVRPIAAVAGFGIGAGIAAVVATYLPWYEVVATVELLGTERGRAVAGLAGWQAHPWGWLIPALAITAVVISVAVAIDRPFEATPALATIAGVGLLALVVASLGSYPPVDRFHRAGTGLGELDRLADRLPEGVTLAFSVRPGLGLWIGLVAALALTAVAVGFRGVRS